MPNYLIQKDAQNLIPFTGTSTQADVYARDFTVYTANSDGSKTLYSAPTSPYRVDSRPKGVALTDRSDSTPSVVDIPYIGRDTNGNATSLVSGDGTSVAVFSNKTVIILASGDTTGATDTAAFDAAITALNTFGGTVQFGKGAFYLDKSWVTGGYIWLTNNYAGGIRVRGISWTDTVINAVDPTGVCFIVESNRGGVGKSAGSRFAFEDLRLVGPGKATAGSIGIDWCDQGNWQNALSWCEVNRVVFDGFETHERIVDVTGLTHNNCWYSNYAIACNIGYNSDILRWVDCQFGENTTATGSETEIAFQYDAASTNHPTNSGNNVIYRERCWYMHQLIVDNVNNNGGVTNADHYFCYAENCQQYGIYGTTATGVSAPANCRWESCHFSLIYIAGQTNPKFEFKNSANVTDMALINCETDSSNGPDGGWITCGSAFGGNITITDSRMPTAGAANAFIIKYGNKLIPQVGYRGTYRFAGADNVPDVLMVRGNSLTQAVRQTYAVTPVDQAVYETWGAMTASSSATYGVSGAAFSIVNNEIASADTAMASGWHKLQQAASGSKPTAEANLRGCFFLTQGGAGVADTLDICVKNAADAYVWKAVTIT